MSDVYSGFVFDLDGTLYNTSAMDEANRSALLGAISEWGSTTREDADRLLSSRLTTYSVRAGRPSMYRATLEMGVPDDLIASWQHAEVKPEVVLVADEQLAAALSDLANVAKLALLTNTRTSIARRAIDALGINPDVFTVIRGGEAMRHPKPSINELKKICHILGLAASDCISVGDRWSVDLEPAKEIGMATLEVQDRDDLLNWLRNYLEQHCPGN